MFETRNDLPAETRARVIEILGPALAGAIDLMLEAKHAHWNVKGPTFVSLHKLFFDIGEVVERHVDTIAERIVQLGGTAEGTIQAVSEVSPLDPYPLEAAEGKAHLESLAGALGSFGAVVRAGIASAQQAGDANTADIFTSISRSIDQQLWFVEAHLQGAPVAGRLTRKKVG